MFHKDFDKSFNRTQKMIYVTWAISLIVALLFLGGFGFVVFKILAHFGIL